MDAEQRRTFGLNIIKFLVGLVLLAISYTYLQSHPAEKVSIVSGFEVIYDRLQITFYTIAGRDTSYLKQKHRLEQYYAELIRVAEDKVCVDAAVLQSLHVNYNSLQKMSIDDLSAVVLQQYSTIAYDYDAQLQQTVCP